MLSIEFWRLDALYTLSISSDAFILSIVTKPVEITFFYYSSWISINSEVYNISKTLACLKNLFH